MRDQSRVAAHPEESPEQLSTERYKSLRAWAIRLTNQRGEVAEDLVQDEFVQFMLGRTKLEEIENIDGYLRRMLRYMHLAESIAQRSSCMTRHSHLPTTTRAGPVGRQLTPPRRVQTSEELHQICTYACSRKESSKAGSVLILRFFLEYFPTEIARILNSSRHSMDELQRFVRREAKLFRNEPKRLRFVNARTISAGQQIKYLKSDCVVMLGLQQMIMDSCQRKCLFRPELEQVYANGKA